MIDNYDALLKGSLQGTTRIAGDVVWARITYLQIETIS